MSEKTTYFVLKEKAVPEVLRKVVEAKRLIESGRCISAGGDRSRGDQPEFFL